MFHLRMFCSHWIEESCGSRQAVCERLQGVPGEIFTAILLAEQSEAEISELEESIADPLVVHSALASLSDIRRCWIH